MKNEFWNALKVFFILTVLTGLVYPLGVTAVAQVFFRHQADGSLIVQNGKTVGSELIGQTFDQPKYFWSRPSATSLAYNAGSSSGSNLGPASKALLEAVQARVNTIRSLDSNPDAVPADLVLASGSGLDPHISVAAADFQVGRIARIRNLPENEVKLLVDRFTEDRQFGIFGQPRVNVLKLNLALDQYKS